MDKVKDDVVRAILDAATTGKHSDAVKALDEYATQQSRIDAINFYNWIENENTIWHNEQEEPLTDDELYELYQSQKPKQ